MGRNQTTWVKRTEITDLQREFIEFLLDPHKGSYDDWSREHNISRDAMRKWKREQYFLDEWDRRAHQVFGGIERVQSVIDMLLAKAQGGDTKAAQLYLQYVDKLTPTRKVIHETNTTPQQMTDEELAAAYENVINLRRGTGTSNS